VVWLVDPLARRAWIHKAGGHIEEISAEGLFTGDDLLPGLHIPLASILQPERSR
jgi:Uma2 family endonuclease